jgi:hypothetical protein
MISASQTEKQNVRRIKGNKGLIKLIHVAAKYNLQYVQPNGIQKS